jgi:hypothetical protein
MTNPTPDQLLDMLKETMALQSWVNPSTLIPDSLRKTSFLDALRKLRADCEVGRGEHAGQWRLSDTARRIVLRQWTATELVERSHASTDIVAMSIGKALGAIPFDPQHASADELVHLRAALSWLPDMGRVIPGLAEQIEAALRNAVVREDIHHLTRHRVLGRESVLRDMRLMVEAARPGSPTLVSISGSGGIGKSTLLAAFFDKQTRRSSDVATLRFDFDRADLNPGTRMSLDRALLQEIGQALPELRAECENMYRSLRAETAMDMLAIRQASAGEGTSAGILDGAEVSRAQESSKSSYSSALADVLETATQHCRQIVLIFDTFERVEAAGVRAVDSTLEWAIQTCRFFGGAFTLITAGRSELITTPKYFVRSKRILLV